MKGNIEVMESILALIETIEEGFEHIQEQLAQLRYEEALGLLQDAMMGIQSIDEAVEPMATDLKENNIDSLGANLKAHMSQVVASYETDAKENLEKLIQDKVLVAFTDWKDEIERVLRPYVDA